MVKTSLSFESHSSQHLDKIRYYNNIYHFDRHAFFIFYLQLLLVHVAARRAKFV